MIKSIVSALLVYSMNCFFLPLSIYNEIDSVLSAFLWGRESEKHKISWVVSDKLSLAKKDGGLGFRNLHQFNRALLAKQAWRILKDPSSLLSWLYKGLYYTNDDFITAPNHRQSSYGWRSIQEGKALLSQGLQYKIGDGKTWQNNSCMGRPMASNSTPRPAHGPIIDPNMTIADLWLPNKFEWNENVFAGVLTPADQLLAKTLYLSHHAVLDTYDWAYTENAQYSVKSGYCVAMNVENNYVLAELPHGDVDIKKRIWKLKISPKIQHFLWKYLSGALATADRLQLQILNVKGAA